MSKHPSIHEIINDLKGLENLRLYLVYLKNKHLYKPEERKRIEFSFEHDGFE